MVLLAFALSNNDDASHSEYVSKEQHLGDLSAELLQKFIIQFATVTKEGNYLDILEIPFDGNFMDQISYFHNILIELDMANAYNFALYRIGRQRAL